MLELMGNAAVFGGITAAISFGIAFLVLKVFGVKEPYEHKYFFVLFGVTMGGMYVLRSWLMTNYS